MMNWIRYKGSHLFAKAPLSEIRGEALRYLGVVIGGLIIDLTVVWIAHQIFAARISVAVVLGFLTAMLITYLAHEFWTFQSGHRCASASKLVKFFATSGATLSTRLVLIWAASPLAELPHGSVVMLVIAFSGSLIVGFLTARVFVFGSDADRL